MQNKLILDIFAKLIKQIEEECFDFRQKGDKKEAFACSFRVKNLKTATDIIMAFPDKITDASQLEGIKGIGKGTLTRVAEILDTGTLQELRAIDTSKNEIDKLTTITGVGAKKAHVLFEAGLTLQVLLNQMEVIAEHLKKNIRHIPVTTICQISKELGLNIHLLTHHQIVGLKYYADIEERIPRDEMTKIETKLIKIAHEIDPKLIIQICGSYRREKPNSGDVDVLITHPDILTETDLEDTGNTYLTDIVTKLTQHKLLVDNLTEFGNTKYMGICRLNKTSKGRRIDIRFVPRNDFAPALLYFTGSKEFNQKMRGQALKKGFTLNEYGIYKLQKKNGINKKGDKVVVHTEKDIFDLIDMPYLEPKNRN